MMETELEALERAHRMFADATPPPALDAGTQHHLGLLARGRSQAAVNQHREVLQSAGRTDAAAADVVAGAYQDRDRARDLTRSVVDEARADTVAPATPMAQREAIRRSIARVRTQRAHVLSARSRARHRAAVLRALRYRMLHRHGRSRVGLRLPAANGRAGIAVRAALSRLGRPYVWGATGPDQFDCSGLVQWSYAQAGIHLDRTTYQQINDGIPVPRSQIRPGDLVFPHAGHVQLAIGPNLVVEAPYPGASVRISPLGNNVAIRRIG
jgi:cell wall-associated NlpC family hydrolase